MQNDSCIALFDGFPITKGHALVIPRSHAASVFDLPAVERAVLWQFVEQVRDAVKNEFSPDAFNIGLHDGTDAGQTVPHAHIHIIPRRKGDVPDPRGGLRWIIPEKAKYWP